MSYMKGGRTNYGEDVGILMLDTVFPRFVGDIGNARSYPFPVRYKILKGIRLGDVMQEKPNMETLSPFIQAAKELEAEGVKVITTSCGYLAAFQRELADAVNVPVITSSLMMAPWIKSLIGKNKSIGLFTEFAKNMNDAYFRRVGWDSSTIPIRISGMPEGAEFPKVYSFDKQEADWEELAQEMETMAKTHMQQHPDTGAILLECTNMGPFAAVIQRASGVPVFGINNLIEFVASAVSPRSYENF